MKYMYIAAKVLLIFTGGVLATLMGMLIVAVATGEVML